MQQMNEERKIQQTQHDMEKEDLRDNCETLKHTVNFQRQKVKSVRSDGQVICKMLEEEKACVVSKLADSVKRVSDLDRLTAELHVKTEQLSTEIKNIHKKNKTNTVPECLAKDIQITQSIMAEEGKTFEERKSYIEHLRQRQSQKEKRGGRGTSCATASGE